MMTSERTIEQTIRETPKETIHRSYFECIYSNQKANKREISVIFSYTFIYPWVILLMA